MCTPVHTGFVGFTGNNALGALAHLAGVPGGRPGIPIVVLPPSIYTAGTDKFTASLPLPDGVPTGEVSVGAHDGDTAYDGVGTGAVETGVVAGQEGLHVSVCLHVILTVTGTYWTTFSWRSDWVGAADDWTGRFTALYITMATRTSGAGIKVKLTSIFIGPPVVVTGDTCGTAFTGWGIWVCTVWYPTL